eukprot:4717714-Amphidinium_carterae.1
MPLLRFAKVRSSAATESEFQKEPSLVAKRLHHQVYELCCVFRWRSGRDSAQNGRQEISRLLFWTTMDSVCDVLGVVFKMRGS